MAVNKVLDATSFSIEVENGTDKTGAKVYRKKNFSGIKTNVAPENVYDVISEPLPYLIYLQPLKYFR